jgi:hypothetical protein
MLTTPIYHPLVARAAALLALLGLVASASAAPGARGADRFRLPSGNVYCAYEHSDLRCVIRTGLKPKPPTCDDGYVMRQTGAARPFCADSIYDPNVPALSYGTTRQFGVFRCSSRTSGLRCTNASGQGFFLSKEHSYTFKEPAPRYGAFKTPSRNIVCGYAIGTDGEASMECGIKSGLRPPPRRIHCLAGDPNDKRVSLTDTGRAAPVLCAGDPGPLLPQIEARARVLGYGKATRFGGIKCSSAAKGLTCRNRSGHGFFLSRERWRSF